VSNARGARIAAQMQRSLAALLIYMLLAPGLRKLARSVQADIR